MRYTDELPLTDYPDSNGYFGEFGGRFVPETLITPLIELEEAFLKHRVFPRIYSGA